MRFQNVCVEALTYTLPPHVLTSEAIESRLASVYDRFNLPVGRLEMMTGIRERRYWDRGTRPGQISALTAAKALDASSLNAGDIGCLIHGSVCRDQLEPATANAVHHGLELPGDALVFDVSNACLGLINGAVLIANLIESGQIRAGLVVGTELGYDLVDGTIETLLNDPHLTKRDVKLAFASLTIGSGSAAMVLCHRSLSRHNRRLLGAVVRCDTSSHELCAGGVEAAKHGDDRPRMQTDSEALLHAGINLAGETWDDAKRVMEWSNSDVDKAVTHQVGRAHRKLLYERLGLDPTIDFATVETLGNTGAAALPLTAAIAAESGHFQQGDRVAWLAIGSGLNCLMLGWEWGARGDRN